MIKLKLMPLVDDEPAKLAVELPVSAHRDLVAYADCPNGQHVTVACIEGDAP